MSKSSVSVCGRTHVKRLAQVTIVLATGLAAAGCSSGVERLSSASFGSGYAEAPDAGRTQTAQVQSPAKATAHGPADVSPRVQVASAARSGPSGGYLQVARVDLAPLEPAQSAPRVQTADGYGAYNKGPLRDGVYGGPRVITPYDAPYGRGPALPPDEDLIIEDGPPAHGKGPYKPSRYDHDRGPRHRGDPGPVHGYKDGPDYPDEPHAGVHDRGPDEYGDGPKLPRHAGPHPGKAGGKIVKVEPGDTLYAIAIRHGSTVRDIIAANGLHDDVIHVGQELIVPGVGPVAYAATVKPDPRRDTKGPRCVETGQCHVVEAGESLGSIAKGHGVAAIEILEANGLSDPRQIRPGHVLTIPHGKPSARTSEADKTVAPYGKKPNTREQYAARSEAVARDGAYPAPSDEVTASSEPRAEDGKAQPSAAEPQRYAAVDPATAPAGDAEKTCEAALSNPLPRSGRTFREPVEGLVIQKFGPQPDGGMNEGINISVPKGTPIKAAENGVVAYVGNELSGFGNLVLIRHADDYVTAYAHTEEVLVKRCDVVKRGQVIAKAGATGDVSQPQLHFEIRKASKPVDPTTLF